MSEFQQGDYVVYEAGDGRRLRGRLVALREGGLALVSVTSGDWRRGEVVMVPAERLQKPGR